MLRYLTPSLLLLTLLACQLPRQATPEFRPGLPGVFGQVSTVNDGPAATAYVYAYLDNRNNLRGPADFGARVEDDGSYLLDLPPGTYHLVARWRAGGLDSGPPRKGDAWALYAGNPLHIGEEGAHRVDFTLQPLLSQQSMRQGSLTSGETGVRGRLVDARDVPVAGAFALAYPTPDYRHSPDWTSLPADSNGQFILYLPGAGRYCLAARTGTRSQPRESEPYGRLGDGDAGCRTLVSGEIIDIGTIILRPYRR